MNILILSSYELNGGAAIAASRLMQALNKSGHNAKMLVRDKQTSDPNVISVNSSWLKTKINFLRFVWERGVIFVNNRFSKKNLFAVSIANTGTDISRHPLVKWADIIHLHWINQGFLSIKNIEQLIQTGKPVVWTMHDMWVGTSICHYSLECENYQTQCANCGLLQAPSSNDLSCKIWKKKKTLLDKKISFVAVSSWLCHRMQKSALLSNADISIIPNVVSTSIFQPADKLTARRAMSFPENKKIIVMGAAILNHSIKGFEYLRQALSIIAEKHNDCLLVLFGNIKNEPAFLANISVPHIYLGTIHLLEKIVQIYQAADVTVVPSLYETFGQTLSEAMACGCPIVSFNNSGQTDIIDHKQNGYLAEYKDAEDLAKGIDFCLENSEKLSLAAREKVIRHYSENVVAERYVELYSQKQS